MTLTTTTTHSVPVAPTTGAPASARPRRGDDHRRVLGAPPGGERPRDARAHRRMARARGLARATSTSRHPARCPRAAADASSRTPRSTSTSRRSPGRSVAGRRRPADGRARGAVPRGGRAGRRGAGARRLPQHAVRPAGPGPRWSDLEWGHELYCLGHLFQAAVARVRTRPDADDGLVDVARRAADLVCEVFGEGGIERICGHAEVEVGPGGARPRARASRATSSRRRLFVERHGRGTLRDIEWGRSYYQDDIAVRDADVLRGHAVRANYLAAGAADVAIETGDDELLRRARPPVGHDRRAPHLRDRRPGLAPPGRGVRRGLGAAVGPRLLRDLCGRGIRDVQLAAAARRRATRATPTSSSARCSTSIETSPCGRRHRVLLREHAAPAPPGRRGRRRHGVAAGAVVAARALVRGVVLPAEHRPHVREPRGLRRDGGCLGHPAAPVRARVDPHDARRRTGGRPRRRDRVPAIGLGAGSGADGCRGAVDPLAARPGVGRGRAGVVRPADGGPEQALDADPHGRPGAVSIERAFAAGDEVELELPVAPRFAAPDPRVDAVRGCLVVERGPEVFALESVDLAGTELAASDFADLRVDPACRAAGRRRRLRGRHDRGRAHRRPRRGAARAVPRLGRAGTVADAGVGAGRRGVSRRRRVIGAARGARTGGGLSPSRAPAAPGSAPRRRSRPRSSGAPSPASARPSRARRPAPGASAARSRAARC